MSVTVVAEAHVVSALSQSTLTIAKPAGLAVGDVMVAFLTHEAGAAVTWTGPSGWTELGTNPRVQPEVNHQSVTYYKVAEAADVAASDFSWTVSGANQWSGSIVAFRGADTTNPIADHAETADANANDPSLTATAAKSGSAAVQFWTYEPGAAQSYTLSEMTEQFQGQNGTALLLGVWTEVGVEPGDLTRTVLYDGAQDDHSGHLVIIQPAATRKAPPLFYSMNR